MFLGRVCNDPVVWEGSDQVNQEPGLGVIDDDFLPIVDQLSLLVKPGIELNEYVEHEADIDHGFQVDPGALSLLFEAEAERNDYGLVDDHEETGNLPSS